jgi:hypothetical protein
MAVGKFFHRNNRNNQCEHVINLKAAPFTKCCSGPKAPGLNYCLMHCYSVNYVTDNLGECTKYFNTIWDCEEFMKTPKGLWWTECNYDRTGF